MTFMSKINDGFLLGVVVINPDKANHGDSFFVAASLSLNNRACSRRYSR